MRKARGPRPAVVPPADEDSRPTIADPRPAKITTARPADGKARQASLDLGDNFTLPPLDLLTPPPADTGPAIDKAALERNARLLESVLDDFHVKGRITEVRPGPVVTMYELEPAPGTKASRVIALADDIARNMSRALGPRRDHPGPHRDRHRAAQCAARGGRAVRTGRLRARSIGSGGAAADPGQEHRRRSGDRGSRADAAPAGRRHHRIGQVGRLELA